ncbi:hypothetical protein GGQ91_005679 [Methylobacterium fujisawaense]|uniref:DUF6429 domain-containing protein n=1 Tax=Methylobacterium fujisawaense TaxID=107400 RepID=A0ABR6DJG3_9HYPH|nr:hypothetical protein [Methylobacterium fujisawaense]
MTRLHAKGMIGNLGGKSKSVMLTDEGVKRSEKLFREMFGRPSRLGVGRPLRGPGCRLTLEPRDRVSIPTGRHP